MSRLTRGVFGIRLAGVAGVVGGVAGPWLAAAWLLQRPEPQAEAPALRPEMVVVPAGSWTIGSPEGEEERYDDERQHAVTLGVFAIAVTEVTQAQYQAVMGTNPSDDTRCGADCPVENVSWLDAIEYLNALSRREGIEECYRVEGEAVAWPRGVACEGYRLPTEAEWEVAARAGKGDRYAGTDDPQRVCDYANVVDATADAADPPWEETVRSAYGIIFACTDGYTGLAPTGRFRANGFGLHDMTGNVWEWVWDWYADVYAPDTDSPIGADRGSLRVGRGGSFYDAPRGARGAYRDRGEPSRRLGNLGFRVARSLPPSTLPSYPVPGSDGGGTVPAASP